MRAKTAGACSFHAENEPHVVEGNAPSHDGHGNAHQKKSDRYEAEENTPAPNCQQNNQRHNQVGPEETRSQKRASHRVVPALEADDRQHKQEQQQNHILPLNEADRHREERSSAQAQNDRRNSRKLRELPS